MTTLSPTHPDSTDPVAPLERALARTRAAARAALIARALGIMVAGLLAWTLVSGWLDYLITIPDSVRWLGMLALLGLAAAWWTRELLPAIRFAPDDVALAVRLESARGLPPGAISGGLELAHAPTPEDDDARLMRQRAILGSAAAFRDQPAAGLVRTAVAWRALGLAAMALLPALLSVWASPTLARTAAVRTLAPWAGAAWPVRFPVEDLTEPGVRSAESPVMLRARLQRQSGSPDVRAIYRVLDERGRVVVPEKSVRLADQGPRSGGLYERLIEPPPAPRPPPAAASETGSGVRTLTLEYRFESPDDATEDTSLTLTDPPRALGAELEITPPAYAESSEVTRGSANAEFRKGSEGVPVALGPALEGSELTLTVRYNTDIVPIDQPGTPPTSTTPTTAHTIPAPRIGDAENELVYRWTLDRSERLTPRVQDRLGIGEPDPTTIVIESIADSPPEVSVTEPPADESVLATAVIPVRAEARDDLGAPSVTIERALPELEPEQIESSAADEPGSVRVAAATLDLSSLALEPGDEVTLTAVARDSLGEAGGREAVRSAPRRLRIISEDDLVAQLRGELTGVRRAAIRLDERQDELIRQLTSGEPPELLSGRQDALGQRLEDQRRVIDRLAERLERNALPDPSLTGLLDEAARILDEASAASDEASEALAQADDASDANEPEDEAADAQRRVRDELAALAGLLDRGEDGWLVRRDVERLLERQRELRSETEQIGRSTIGREVGQLSEPERSALEDIARRQREQANDAREALEELAERSEQMAGLDPAQADAMGQASSQGADSGLERSLERAAERVEQNQTGAAAQDQDEAIEALEEMLQTLEDAEAQRDSALKRALASIVESIEALIVSQERELGRLRDSGSAVGLDAGMIALDQNTVGVLGEIPPGEAALRPVADQLRSASEAQRRAVGSLRGGDLDSAERDELDSLSALREAKAAAEEAMDDAAQRERARTLEALKKAYAEALEQQAALRADAASRLGVEQTRRGRAETRAIGSRQTTLRESLQDTLTQTEGLGDTVMFRLAHTRLDDAMGRAAETLSGGSVDAGVVLQQGLSLEVLRLLIQALSEDEPQDQEFDEGAQGGGGGSGGQGGEQPLIPPLAEMQLLRGLQGQIAELTRLADEQGVGGESIDAASIGALQADLAERAFELIEQMRPPQGPAMPGLNPDRPGDEEEEENTESSGDAPGSTDGPADTTPGQDSAGTEP